MCPTCPRAHQKRLFEKQAREYVGVKLGEDYKFDFQNTLEKVFLVSSLEGYGPDKITLRNSILLGIYIEERGRSRETT